MNIKTPYAKMGLKSPAERFGSLAKYDEYLEELLKNGNYKQWMYEHTREVRWLYHNSNKLLQVIDQKDVWLLINRLQDRIEALTNALNLTTSAKNKPKRDFNKTVFPIWNHNYKEEE